MSKEFDDKLAEEQKAGRIDRLENSPPIGMNPDGTLAIFKPGEVKPFVPTIIGPDGEIDDLRAAYEAQESEEDTDPDDTAGEE